MIDLISPITSEMKFIHLGSGVGQVVLQVAALVDCKLCVGIEEATILATMAVEMDRLFQKWMLWYGKKYSPYKLHQVQVLFPFQWHFYKFNLIRVTFFNRTIVKQ